MSKGIEYRALLKYAEDLEERLNDADEHSSSLHESRFLLLDLVAKSTDQTLRQSIIDYDLTQKDAKLSRYDKDDFIDFFEQFGV